MKSINIYLTYDGNCFEAFSFYKSVFNGEFAHISKFSEMPEDPRFPLSDEDKEKVMHMTLLINNSIVLMGSDTGGEWAAGFKQGNNFSISINVDTKEEADKLFAGLSVGGKIIMPMGNTFWGSYFGNFTDKFGVNWMVSVEDKTA